MSDFLLNSVSKRLDHEVKEAARLTEELKKLDDHRKFLCDLKAGHIKEAKLMQDWVDELKKRMGDWLPMT